MFLFTLISVYFVIGVFAGHLYRYPQVIQEDRLNSAQFKELIKLKLVGLLQQINVGRV